MKKLTFILSLLMATGMAKGQEIVTEFWHENGKYFIFHNMVFGGKQISYWYSRNVITPMMEQGINPGLMINQPYK